MQSYFRHVLKTLWIVLLIFPLLMGCNPFSHDPEQTVIIEVSSITRNSDRQEVLELLKGMTDNASHSMHIESDRDSMRITLSPVSDVQAFARRIKFGHVTKVKNRTITVEYPVQEIFI